MKKSKRIVKNGFQRSNKSNLSGAVQAEFGYFREYHPANRFSRNLRCMLMDFLMSEGATEAWYLQDLLYDMDGLFELLDAIETEDAATVAASAK